MAGIRCGLAGFFAVLLVIGATLGFIQIFGLWTWEAWRELYASEVLLWFVFLVLSLFVAKVLATVVHVTITFCKIWEYRSLIHTAVHDQDRTCPGKVRKVLICHASVGSGHSRAAQALASALHRLDDSVEVRVVDLMEPPYADRTLIYFYKDWYLRLVGGETVCGNLGGLFVGFLFDRANNVHDSFTGGSALQRRITQSFLLNFMQLLCETKPDVVVHTHFLAPELVASLRRRHGLKIPQVTVVTDMDVHAWWYQQPTDHYFVPRENAKFQLEADGVPGEDITISGIPIMPQFKDTLDSVSSLSRDGRRRRFLNQMDAPMHEAFLPVADMPVIVQMSTGRNMMESDLKVKVEATGGQLVRLQKVDVPDRWEAWVQRLHDAVLKQPPETSEQRSLVEAGRPDNLGGDGMQLDDGKPLCLVVVDPYPGQEERNASMLLEEGAGIWIWDYRDLSFRLDRILSTPPEDIFSLNWYRRNAQRLAKPEAALKIARYVLSDAPRQRMMQEEFELDVSSGDSPPTNSQGSWSVFDYSDECVDRRGRRSSHPRRLRLSDFKDMKALDSNAVPHEDSDCSDDVSENGLSVQVQED
ncbi:ugtP [Symbiodinium pilosum]|uniref:UgtP protein n=1 Tax=Symbiodinium pilosum TaxID=2952 RepID=A0A812NTG9_SYMPI|nr:ugtP [Symbiodinium pilosum]